MNGKVVSLYRKFCTLHLKEFRTLLIGSGWLIGNTHSWEGPFTVFSTRVTVSIVLRGIQVVDLRPLLSLSINLLSAEIVATRLVPAMIATSPNMSPLTKLPTISSFFSFVTCLIYENVHFKTFNFFM